MSCKNTRNTIICIFLFCFISVCASIAWAGRPNTKLPVNRPDSNLSVNTFYPSPFGRYQKLTTSILQLTPLESTDAGDCKTHLELEGSLYFNKAEKQIYICDSELGWIVGSGLWAKNESNKSIYPLDISGDGSEYKIGIGTMTPEFQLSLEGDGSFIAFDQPSKQTPPPADGIPVLTNGRELKTGGEGAKLIWWPKMGAFRAGYVEDDEWDAVNIGPYSVAMGLDTIASGKASIAAGGWKNEALGDFSTVSGGRDNKAYKIGTTVSGGKSNEAGRSDPAYPDGEYATVSGGELNKALANYANVSGGQSNEAQKDYSTVSGGKNNIASEIYASIGGGLSNTASGQYSRVSGGESNQATSIHSTVGGGKFNKALKIAATVGGGDSNEASGEYSVVGGGQENFATGKYSAVAGGKSNRAEGESSVAAGGENNKALGKWATVSGGKDNIASGEGSIVPGGEGNQANGDYSFASGHNMRLSDKAKHTFLWGVSSAPITPIDTSDAFIIYSGSVGINVFDPSATLDVGGNIKANLKDIAGTTPLLGDSYGEIGYDIAELFEASEEVEAGDVLVLDNKEKGLRLRKSLTPYEKGVVGIVSAAPAILFEGSELQIAPQPGSFIKGKKPPVALNGRVICKVTNENGPIELGDLLTTSSTPGHAMKATDREKSFGTIVGKALESFEGGSQGESTGVISVFVMVR